MIKFLIIFILCLFFSTAATPALAENNCQPGDTRVECVIGELEAPPFITGIGTGAQGISKILTNLVNLAYVIASIIFIFMIVWGSIQWITSGGDKEAIQKARGRITNAIIGMVLLALSFLIVKVITDIIGIKSPIKSSTTYTQYRQ